MLLPGAIILVMLNLQATVGHQEPPLDMTKNLIIPNLRMFSDITHIFYHPESGHAVPIQYTKAIPGTDLLTKGFGLIPCACHREELYCSCCVYVRLQRFGFERTACSNLTVKTDELELDLTIDYSGYTLANRSLSLRHPPPFCIPTPQIPALLSCVRVHDIKVKEGRIEFCINFEIKVVAIPNPVFILEFTCVNYGQDGFILERPATHHHLHDNGTQPQAGANWDLLHQHLVTEAAPGASEYTPHVEVSTPPGNSHLPEEHPHTTSLAPHHPPDANLTIETHYSHATPTGQPVTEPHSNGHHNPTGSEGVNHGVGSKSPQRNGPDDTQRVRIVSLNVADLHRFAPLPPSQRRSGGYLLYDGYK